MNGRRWLRLLAILGVAMFLAATASLAQDGTEQGELAAVGTAFTYQGRLTDGGSPADGIYDFRFRLYDAPSGGTQVGTAVLVNDKSVNSGLFTVILDYGNVFRGDGRYLEVGVRPGGSAGAYTLLSPRQALTAAPYALYSLSTAGHDHWGKTWTGASGAHGLRLEHTAASGFTYGLAAQTASSEGIGVWGRATAASGSTYGVLGRSDSEGGSGVYGAAVTPGGNGLNYGVQGYSNSSDGYAGFFAGHGADALWVENSAGGRAIQARAGNDTAVWGRTDNGLAGLDGWNGSTTGRGVSGWSSADNGPTSGVYGQAASTAGAGLYGWATAASGFTYGVYGQSDSPSGFGVLGTAAATSGSNFGVYGATGSPSGTGVFGTATATSGTNYGVYGATGSASGYAGYFSGRLHVNGTLSKAAGSFQIDHPLDPANQYLYHSFVESPDMKNLYDGVVFLDANGEATVTLPPWFEALNRDVRYQLTPIGGWAPLYIAQELQDNAFKIAGGEPEMKVSWQVTGIRQDAYANAHRIPVEEPKPAEERGLYLHPTEAGQPAELGLDYRRNAAPGERQGAR